MRGNRFACRATAHCQFRRRRTAGDLLFLSGQDPATSEDKKHGKVGRGATEEEAYGHARLARFNLLSQMRSILGSRDRVLRIVKVLGMMNVADDLPESPRCDQRVLGSLG